MAKLGSSAVVITLTACALAVVTTLALQAKSSATVTTAGSKAGVTSSSSPKSTTGTGKGHGGGTSSAKAVDVPKDSGSGKRVVYSLGQKRVWLVDPGSDTATFTGEPSTVSPSPGTYRVYYLKQNPYTGSDGVQVENGVLFHESGGVVFGFSAAVDGDTPAPDPNKHTGGIRETVPDSKDMFAFAPVDTKVVVVP